MLENLVQSERDQDLKLSDQFILSMKVLGVPHMAQIRANERRYFDQLNMPNYGLPNFTIKSKSEAKSSPYFEIPNGFYSDENTENCFAGKCLILSIILGMLTFTNE